MYTVPRTRTVLGLLIGTALAWTAVPAGAQAPTSAAPPAFLAPAAPASMPPTVSAIPVPGVIVGAAGRACSHWWMGHEAEIEQFLREAPVVRMEGIPVGVTKPRRAYFEAWALVGSMAWKVLAPKPGQRQAGYEESHKAEIAAYRLNRLLGMDMVPPVVERRLHGRTGAAVMWIENVRRWDANNPARAPMRHWSRQVSRMKLFDQLIANIDRNQGNLLQDDDGHLFLIDHSRAFTTRSVIKGLEGPTQVDRGLWSRIDALTREELEAALGDVLTKTQISAMLKRRDLMRRQIDDLVRRRGEDIAFLPPAPEELARTGRATPHAALSVVAPAGA